MSYTTGVKRATYKDPVFDHPKPMTIYVYEEPRKWWQFWKSKGPKPPNDPWMKPGEFRAAEAMEEYMRNNCG